MNTTYFLNCVAGNVFNTGTIPSLPSQYYLGLSTTAPNIDGTGVSEPPESCGYARVELTALSAPVDGVIKNSSAINFEESTGSWGTVTHYVIFDSADVGNGNLLVFGSLSSPRTVDPSTIVTIRTNYLELSVLNPQ